MAEKLPSVGGQAVIEGVMMRGGNLVACAVREPGGGISVDVHEVNSFSDRHPFFKKPFLRGCVTLVESLAMGMKALAYSARVSGNDDEEGELTTSDMALTMAGSVALAVGLFIVLPTWSMRFLRALTGNPLWLNLSEGLLRMAIFLIYITAISRMEDIRRVFMYHGAEHKTIYTYEANLPLTVENARGMSTLHPRCGTNFLMIVMMISIFIFAFLGWPGLLWRVLSRVLLMPVIAGVSYEIIRFAGKNVDKPWVRMAIMPGLLLQKLTTRQPKDEMLEVAIASLKAVLPADDPVLALTREKVPDEVALKAASEMPDAEVLAAAATEKETAGAALR